MACKTPLLLCWIIYWSLLGVIILNVYLTPYAYKYVDKLPVELIVQLDNSPSYIVILLVVSGDYIILDVVELPDPISAYLESA